MLLVEQPFPLQETPPPAVQLCGPTWRNWWTTSVPHGHRCYRKTSTSFKTALWFLAEPLCAEMPSRCSTCRRSWWRRGTPSVMCASSRRLSRWAVCWVSVKCPNSSSLHAQIWNGSVHVSCGACPHLIRVRPQLLLNNEVVSSHLYRFEWLKTKTGTKLFQLVGVLPLQPSVLLWRKHPKTLQAL